MGSCGSRGVGSPENQLDVVESPNERLEDVVERLDAEMSRFRELEAQYKDDVARVDAEMSRFRELEAQYKDDVARLETRMGELDTRVCGKIQTVEENLAACTVHELGWVFCGYEFNESQGVGPYLIYLPANYVGEKHNGDLSSFLLSKRAVGSMSNRPRPSLSNALFGCGLTTVFWLPALKKLGVSRFVWGDVLSAFAYRNGQGGISYDFGPGVQFMTKRSEASQAFENALYAIIGDGQREKKERGDDMHVLDFGNAWYYIANALQPNLIVHQHYAYVMYKSLVEVFASHGIVLPATGEEFCCHVPRPHQ